MPRLSVIVTSYNIEDYLEECLDTIVGQTLDDMEIIVVDDGSSDSSPDIVRHYAERDDRVVPVLLETNSVGGVATAANAGLQRATGTWIGFADGDDVYDPRMFELLVSAAEKADADLAMCDYVLLDDQDGTEEPPADAARWHDLDDDVVHLDDQTRKQVLRFIAVPWRKVYRRSMLDEGGLQFPVGDYFYEDNPFHWFTVLSAGSVALVPEVLCKHRVARVGQTMSTVDARLFKIFEHHDTILDWLRERDLADEYGPTLLGWAMSQMEWISKRTPPELRRELFDVMRQVYGRHDQETVERALVEGGKGRRAQVLSAAVVTNNFATFNRVIDEGVGAGSVFTAAQYHLRYSGVGPTAAVAGKFAANRVRRLSRALARRARRLAAELKRARSNPDPVTRGDLMFALMVVEQRLSSLEKQLHALEGKRD